MQQPPDFSQLREILSREPCENVWSDLLDLFERWPFDESRAIALSYAQDHLSFWPDELRAFCWYRPQHPAWPLARTARLDRLDRIDLSSCQHLVSLDLRELDKPSFWSLERLHTLQNLHSLDLSASDQLYSLHTLPPLPRLRSLRLDRCHRLQDLRAIASFPQLSLISLDNCASLQDFSALSLCTHLRTLSLRNCEQLIRTDTFLPSLFSLQRLSMSGCTNLRSLRGFSTRHALSYLDLSDCINLENIASLASLPSLERLIVSRCDLIWPPPPHADLVSHTEIFSYLKYLHSSQNNAI